MNEIDTLYGTSDRGMANMKPFNPSKLALAMAFVPDQIWETPYDVMEGIHRGTLFSGLDKPFMGGGNRL